MLRKTMLNNKALTSFNTYLMLTVAGIVALAITFSIYVRAEKYIDDNHEIRFQSHKLADASGWQKISLLQMMQQADFTHVNCILDHCKFQHLAFTFFTQSRFCFNSNRQFITSQLSIINTC
ncbi:MAG: hypothetical protein ACJAW1_003779 [Glaciecola sp.]|jgi:hypothetical protein